MGAAGSTHLNVLSTAISTTPESLSTPLSANIGMSSHPYHGEKDDPLRDFQQGSSSSYTSKASAEPNQPEDIDEEQPPAYVANPGPTNHVRLPGEFWYLGIQIPNPHLPRAGIDTQKYPGYDPKVDWEKLEATIEQKPAQYDTYDVADPLRVGRILLTSTTFQRDALNDYVIAVTGKDLCHWLYKYLAVRGYRAGKAGDTMRGFAMGPLGYDMWLADWSIKGGLGGHDAIALVEVVCDSDDDDLRLLMEQYKATRNVELTEAIKKKYSGRKLERLLLSVLKLDRPPNTLPIQATQVATDVDALWDATRRRPRDDAITEVFTKRSRSHIAAVISQYSTRHGTSLRHDIKKILTGSEYGHAILYILDGIKSKRDGQGAWRDAKLIMSTMTGVGIKHTELQYRVVRAQWDKQRFVTVKKAFKERYGKTLEEKIAEETSSYYKNIFFVICQQTQDLEGGPETYMGPSDSSGQGS